MAFTIEIAIRGINNEKGKYKCFKSIIARGIKNVTDKHEKKQ